LIYYFLESERERDFLLSILDIMRAPNGEKNRER